MVIWRETSGDLLRELVFRRLRDTSDTSWSSDESGSTDVEFEEYEVTSIPSPETMSNCDSSGSDVRIYLYFYFYSCS
ncbi:Protein of unknown function [Gryllus bimaculatus]|nr:Protein of unknown function [Gryllus bimaculatus]